ncbi:MAG: WD40 repeat domain-containing protein [Ktedonobacteraceae bacterium]
MNSREEHFQSESVDEQINQLRQITHRPAGNGSPDECMIHDLRKISTDYTQSGERVWSRLAERVAQQNEAPNAVQSQTRERFHTERSTSMQTGQLPTLQSLQPMPRRKPQRVFALVASLLVAAVLVGMMGIILALSHNHQSTTLAAKKTVTATAPSLPIGSVVYTRSSATGTNLSPSAAWSPDSKRIATLAVNLQSLTSQLLIWDATTGSHLLTAPVAENLNEVLWSPTGKYLALNNLQTIVIVDSQTGSIVNTIDFHATTASRTSATGQSPLSSLLPHAGSFGFYAVAWTPDGTSLAVAVSYSTYGKVELINPVTGAVNVTFSAHASTIATALSFSSDGQYLAVAYPNDSRIVVWQVSTQAVAFQQDDLQAESILWQPGTHNLAREVLFPASVQLWDIGSKKQVKTYPGITSFTWSPDGKELATYTNISDALRQPNTKTGTGTVVLINATSGDQVAIYQSQHPYIDAVSWSPDGRYLASAETADLSSSSTQILVWIA